MQTKICTVQEENMPNRIFGHIELITSSTIVISVHENGRTRREEISRANPHIPHDDFKVGDPITFWSPRLVKGFVIREENQRERDLETKAQYQSRAYECTHRRCAFCSGETMANHTHEICIRCGNTQNRT